jgi:probable phosphoglycerate mutase
VDANREMRYLGRRDDPLNSTGETQAAALARRFEGLRLDAVVSSPLARALATAQRIAAAAGCGLHTDRRLAEMAFGRWEGLTPEEVRSGGEDDARLLERWRIDPTCAAPGGESLAEVQRRVVELADELRRQRPGESIALVTHVGPIKALLCDALGLPLDRTSRLFLDPATISVVDLAEPPVVRLVNDHGHLGWAAARWLLP